MILQDGALLLTKTVIKFNPLTSRWLPYLPSMQWRRAVPLIQPSRPHSSPKLSKSWVQRPSPNQAVLQVGPYGAHLGGGSSAAAQISTTTAGGLDLLCGLGLHTTTAFLPQPPPRRRVQVGHIQRGPGLVGSSTTMHA